VTTEPEHDLADAIRDVLRRFHDECAPPDKLSEATELARRMYDLLEGTPREPWFAEGISDDRHQRRERMRRREHALFRGRANPMAPPITSQVVRREDGSEVIEGRVTVGRRYEGPPNGVHGGYVAGLFDDVLGAAQSLIDGPSGLTGTLHVRYRNVTPLDTELTFHAWIEHVSGRRIKAQATCHAGDVLTAEAEALFVRVDMKAMARRAMGHGREATPGE
jgi:acyl-coenzyme A thioesterase PaaI-like protein